MDAKQLVKLWNALVKKAPGGSYGAGLVPLKPLRSGSKAMELEVELAQRAPAEYEAFVTALDYPWINLTASDQLGFLPPDWCTFVGETIQFATDGFLEDGFAFDSRGTVRRVENGAAGVALGGFDAWLSGVVAKLQKVRVVPNGLDLEIGDPCGLRAKSRVPAKAAKAAKPSAPAGTYVSATEADRAIRGGKWFRGYTSRVEVRERARCAGNFKAPADRAEYVLFRGGLTVGGELRTNAAHSIYAVEGNLDAGSIDLRGDAVLVVTGRVRAKRGVKVPRSEGLFVVGGKHLPASLSRIEAPVVRYWDSQLSRLCMHPAPDKSKR